MSEVTSGCEHPAESDFRSENNLRNERQRDDYSSHSIANFKGSAKGKHDYYEVNHAKEVRSNRVFEFMFDHVEVVIAL